MASRSLVAQTVTNLAAMWESRVRSLSQEDLLEKEMATHSSILAWKIPWTEEPDGLQSMGLQRIRYHWRSNTLISLFEPRAHAPQLEKSPCASTREKSVGHSEDLLQLGKSLKKKKKKHFAQHPAKVNLPQLLPNSTLGVQTKRSSW